MNNGIVQVATFWCLFVIGVSSFSTLHFGLRQSLVGTLQIQSGTPSLQKSVARSTDTLFGRRWSQYTSSASSSPSEPLLGTRLFLAVDSPPSEDTTDDVSEETSTTADSTPENDSTTTGNLGTKKFQPRNPPKDFKLPDQVEASTSRATPKTRSRKPRNPPKDFIPPDKVEASQFKPRNPRSDFQPNLPVSTSNRPRNARRDFVPRSEVTNETAVSPSWRRQIDSSESTGNSKKRPFSRQNSNPTPPRTPGWIPYNRSFVVQGGNFTDLPKSERKEISQLEYGTIVKGWVARITEMGVYVDVGAKSNPMMYSSQLPGDVRANLTIGQDIDVRLISYEPEKNRARIGFLHTIQATGDENETELLPGSVRKESDTFEVGSVVKGVVITTISAGAFVDVGATRNAYLPSVRVPDTVGVLKSGQEVEVRITSYNAQRKQLHLGIIVDGVDHSGFQEAALQLVNHGWNTSSFVAAKVVDVSDARATIEVNISDLNNETEGILTGNLPAVQLDRDQVSRNDAKVGETIDVRLSRILDFVPLFTTHSITRTPRAARNQPRKPRSDFEPSGTAAPNKNNAESIKSWIQRTPGWKPYPREALSDGTYKEEEGNERKELSDFEVGTVVKGWVAKITDFGAFVDIGANTNILVHISHIAANFVDNIHDYLKLGQDVDVKLLSYDSEKRQIRASLMDGDNDPSSRRQESAFVDHQKEVLHDLWFHEWDRDKVAEGRVVATTNFGAFVRVDSSEIMDVCSGSFQGLIPISTIGRGHISDVTDYLKVNDIIRVRLTRIFDHKATLEWVKDDDDEMPEQRSIRYYNSQEPDIAERAQFKYEFSDEDDDDAMSDQYVDVGKDEVDIPIIKKKNRTRRNKKFKALEELYEMVLDRYGYIPAEELDDEGTLIEQEAASLPDDKNDLEESHENEVEYSPVQPDDEDDNLEDEDEDQTEESDMESYDEDEDVGEDTEEYVEENDTDEDGGD